MKINQSIIKAVTLFGLLASVACTGNYKKINTPPYNATEDDLIADDYKIQGALSSMQGWVVPFQEHNFQFVNVLLGNTLGGYLSEKKGWTEKISTFNATYDWTEVAFKDIIPGIFIAHTQLKSITDDEIPLSVAEIIKVAAMHQVTDIYGPIPYSKVGQNGELTAPYDSQQEIYDQMFQSLTQAVNTLNNHRSEALNHKADQIYGGDLTRWIRFANSLKLRLAMRIVYADPQKARQMAEEAVHHEVGVMRANTDNAYVQHPVQNLYFMLTQQWGDYRASADIVSYMNGFEDPRRDVYFTTSTFTKQDGEEIVNGFYGLRCGIKGTDSAQGGNYSNMKVSKSDKLCWFNAAEVAFLKAEGALRQWDMGGSAEDLYKEGIRLSFEEWGVSGAENYAASQATPGDYDDPKMGYSHSASSNVSITFNTGDDFEHNLERIITQKWIANYRATGVEAWTEFRRTGYPKLMNAPFNQSQGVISATGFARRMEYPMDEFTNNPIYYQQAVSELLKGADNMATRVWWDCNPNTSNQ